MTSPFHITLAQINPVVGAITANADKIIALSQQTATQSDLIVFPEMALCGYPPEDLVLKPSFMDEIEKQTDRITEISKDIGTALVIPTPWRDGDDLYNGLLVIHRGEIVHKQYKIHLPNYGVFDEQRLFTKGAMPEPFEFMSNKIGFLICEDMWFGNVASHLKEQNAEILVTVNASPFDLYKQSERLHHATKTCEATGLPLIYVNQCGGQDELVFDGGSFAMSETGQIIIQAEYFNEDMHETIWEKLETGHFLCQSDTDLGKPDQVEMIYKAAVTGLRDYVTKAGFTGVLIGLSGGVDSALAAAIAVDALGSEFVHCVMMPSEYTSDESLTDAKDCASALKARYETISIENAVKAFNDTLAPHFHKDTPSLTFENIQSRSRGLILMALSNATGYMMVSTGNKSEMAVGYATLYGDMCGGFNPLKDIYKTQVYELCRWRNKNKPSHCFGPSGIVIPENILTKAPTAELKDNQTDQDSLPPYNVLDDILESLIEKDMSIDEITAKGHEKSLVVKVWKLLDRAEYKRRQAPPGVKITTKSFGKERRYPIINHFTRIIETQ